MSDIINAAKVISQELLKIPKIWDGKTSIVQMKEAGYSHWRQMEWIGFYFQFLCENYLSNLLKIPGPKFGKVQFDAFYEVPWDFKAHAINTSSHQIIVNDSIAISNGIKEFGSVGVILALGEVEYNDNDRSFQKWHQSIKGELSKYEIERIQRGAWSRLRKVSFDLKQISFILINDDTLMKSGSFQKDFRNSDGTPRKAKVLLDLEKIDDEIIMVIDF
ncbi:MAG TPA: hypothetical protein PLV01_01735 [Candidatus Kapabacteria bacterium]|jgi:hypothetical protein|nr:hypothetical protein [Candidatus Kapabacteria bacterium]HPU23042.1 hypothetical protein [Candidatus Kapabacteria bacterium]